MKKFLLLFLGVMSLFAFTACDDSSDKTIPPTAPDMSKPDTLTGTYNVTFFATLPDSENEGLAPMVRIGTMTTNCQKAIDLGILTRGENNPAAKTCDPATFSTDNPNDPEDSNAIGAQIYGQQAVMKYEETGLVIETKLQLWQKMMQMSPNDTYQYTKYSAVPKDAITEKGINSDNIVLGVSGRNLEELSDNPSSEFNVTKLDDGSLKIDLNLKGKKTLVGEVNAPTVVLLQKVSDIPVTINPNTLFVTKTGNQTADDIYAKFETNPQSAE